MLLILSLLACRSGDLTVVVDPSLQPGAAEAPSFADGAPRELGRLESSAGVGVDFVRGEVVVSVADAAAGAAVAAELGGSLVHEVELAAGTLAVVRLDDPEVYDRRVWRDALAELVPEGSGEFRVSDEATLGTLAAAAELAVAGESVTVDFHLVPSTFLDQSSIEGELGVYGNDAFAWPFLADGSAQDYGVTRAWLALELADRFGPRVPVAVIDQDILTGRDYSDHASLRAETDNADSRLHGTKVASVLASRADDGEGGAGVAAPVAELSLYEANEFFLNGVELVERASADGARVINLSWGSSWPEAFSWLLHAPINHFATVTGTVLVVAAAGNDGDDIGAHDGAFGAQSTYVFPCEVPDVLCVGGEALDSTERDPGSNYGADVDLFGPYALWITDPEVDGLGLAMGTSFASPFVAGAAALVLAADPELGPADVRSLLIDTANGRVGHRAVNVDLAVRTALGGVPPLVSVDPGELVLSACQAGAFSAVVEDDEDHFDYAWTSDRDGLFATGPLADTVYLSPGSHVVTLEVTDPLGLGGTATATFLRENSAPVVTLEDNYVEECEGAVLTLRASAVDCDLSHQPALGFEWYQGAAWVASGPSLDVVAYGGESYTVRVTDPGGEYSIASAYVQGVGCASDPPVVTITEPATDLLGDDGPVYAAHDDALGLWYVDVRLAATATDPEDGALSSIRWTTDRTDLQSSLVLNGASGTARLYGRECTGELHTLTASVTDASGVVGSATRQIFVWTVC